MKKQLLFLGTCFLFMNAFAQIGSAELGNASVPNAGFENWVSKGPYEEPAEWYTYNRYYSETGMVVCEKTTDSKEGLYALKLISKYSAMAGVVFPGWALLSTDTAVVNIIWGFPCTQRPVYFKCDYKYDHRGADIGMIYIKFTKWDSSSKSRILVAENFKQLTTSVVDWTLCQLKISYKNSYTPDTCSICLVCSDETTAVDSTSLIVDNLRMNDFNSINPVEKICDIQVYPSLANEKLTVISGSKDIKLSSMEILDLQGRIVKQLNNVVLKSGNALDIRLDGIQDGIFVLRLTSENKQLVKKFSKISGL
jgi:hypothetical protein